MPWITVAAIVVFVGYAVFTRVTGNTPQPQSSVKETPEIVFNETPSDEPSPKPTPSTEPAVTPVVGGANIDISVDSNISQDKQTMKLVYPQATKVSDNVYETSDSGDQVYEWYKSQMEQKNFNIRNNVRTKANDKFKAVLQGESATESFKVTIDQESASAKTSIRVE